MYLPRARGRAVSVAESQSLKLSRGGLPFAGLSLWAPAPGLAPCPGLGCSELVAAWASVLPDDAAVLLPLVVLARRDVALMSGLQKVGRNKLSP